jgi:formamidopyrimidine-DNA glycosylase
MPELPEVESTLRTMCDARPSLIGRKIGQVHVAWVGVISGCSADIFQQQLQGAVVTTAGRHGKYLVFGLEGGGQLQGKRFHLVIHLRMTGNLSLVQSSTVFERHTRLLVELDENLALRFDDPRKFGRVWLVDDPEEITKNLGPDALRVGFAAFASRYAAYRRQLKPLLLDQAFVSGVGNIYADESLYRAGLHPLTNSAALSTPYIRRLHAAVVSVLQDAVDVNGANIDGVFKAGGFRVSVYGREGLPCYSCGNTIVKIRVGQRGTHFCPYCQVML